MIILSNDLSYEKLQKDSICKSKISNRLQKTKDLSKF